MALRIALLVLCSILFTNPLLADEYLSITPTQEKCIDEHLELERQLAAPYLFGAPVTLQPGDPVDCSLLLYRIFFS